jgi:hypothetical protein
MDGQRGDLETRMCDVTTATTRDADFIQKTPGSLKQAHRSTLLRRSDGSKKTSRPATHYNDLPRTHP